MIASVLKEHSRFQLEATKLGRTVVFQVTVFERTEKNRSRLYAETQCTDPMHFILQFIIRDAADFDFLLQKFLLELDYRGFIPLRYRLFEAGRWNDWIALPAVAPQAGAAKGRDETRSLTNN